MALSNTLTTNEIKDAGGAEVEFQRLQTEGRTAEFAKVGETYNAQYRLMVSHQEIGTGTAMRRRSRIGFRKTVTGVSGIPRDVNVYTVADIPIGDLAAVTEVKNVIANLISFLATTGGTTVLYDCTGTGAAVLVDGSL